MNKIIVELKGNYDVFVIDPPWPQRKGGLRKVRPRQGKDLPYQTMPLDEIFTLLDKDILSHANNPHVVFMWCIEKFLCLCRQKMVERGYRIHTTFIWDKTNGVAPAFTVRYSHEYLIWFYKPKLIPVAREVRGKYRTVFVEKAREHSRKPDIAYKMIHDFYPHLRKIDVFSREKRPHYDQYGNECNLFSNQSF